MGFIFKLWLLIIKLSRIFSVLRMASPLDTDDGLDKLILLKDEYQKTKFEEY